MNPNRKDCLYSCLNSDNVIQVPEHPKVLDDIIMYQYNYHEHAYLYFQVLDTNGNWVVDADIFKSLDDANICDMNCRLLEVFKLDDRVQNSEGTLGVVCEVLKEHGVTLLRVYFYSTTGYKFYTSIGVPVTDLGLSDHVIGLVKVN